MPSKVIANYTDSVFNEVKQAFEQRSDDFPVAMLPVRLETRFMNETRYVTTSVPHKKVINIVVQRIYKLIFQVRIWLPKTESQNQAQILKKLNAFDKTIAGLNRKRTLLKTIESDDRRILRDASQDLKEDFDQLEFSSTTARQKVSALQNQVANFQHAIEQINEPGESSYKKGYDYLKALEQIEKDITAIYVDRSATPFNLDSKLDNIDAQIAKMNALIKQPDFKATVGTINKITSKVSFIKRQQKSSPIKLLQYKFGYTGGRDLRATEYALRADINGLKVRIDEEHVPYMRLLEELKRYSIRRLAYRVDKAFFMLRAENKNGYQSYNNLMETKEWLYDQLHAIRERAHRPLDGEYDDVNMLKTRYGLLATEIQRFINKSKKFRPKDRYKRAALTRLETHLTDEYLDDLQDLLPGRKTLEEQAFTTTKVLTTSSSANKTERSLKSVRDFVKTANGTVDGVLHEVKAQLEAVQKTLNVSASNTILIPKTQQAVLRSTLDSLKSHMQNMVARNKITTNHPVLAQNNAIIDHLETLIEDQQTDVFDQRDWFYDEFKKRITFTIKAETVKELWVRIYPDDIAIDNHDERITEEEERIAHDYYYEVYSKSPDQREDYKLGAFRAASASLGVRRAAYIIKAVLPDEVKNDSVAQRKNSLIQVIKKLKQPLPEKLKRRYVESPLYLNQKLGKELEHLAGKLQNALATTAFDHCLENKSSLDDLLAILKWIYQQFERDLANKKLDQRTLAAIEAQMQTVKNATDTIVAFYKTNIKALNEPFKPNLSFKPVEKKTKTWDRAGITEVMPDRFIVVTKRNEQYIHAVTGKQILNPLQVSIDPSGNQAERFVHLPNGDLEVPEEIRWLFDFDAAVNAGMAVRIPLQDDDFELGFDLVMAVGVQNTDEQTGQETLNKLLTNHLYSSGGMEYLPVGTATNNTEHVKSPYKAIDNDVDAAFDLFFNQTPTYYTYSVANELKMTDGQMFKDALGLPNDVADVIRHHEKLDIAHGRAMNRALYNSTLKYYFSIMINNLMNGNDIGRTLPYLMEHVSAVGTVPSFHIDGQPYGLLPITPYRDFKVTGNTAKGTEGSFLKNLTIFLNATRHGFEQFTDKPQTINGQKYKNDPQKEFIKILGLEPFSKEFFYRFGTNLSSRWSEPGSEELDFPVNWDNIHGAHTPSSIASHYDYLLKGMGHTTPATRTRAIQRSKAYINRYMQGNFIHGHLVQDSRLPQDQLATIINGAEGENYIQWLRDNHTRDFLRKLDVEDLPKVLVESEEQIQNTLLMFMLRGALLYDDSQNALRALDVLKELDVKTLDRLLANHIDLCSYRLDAWMNGLSNLRLREMRSTQTTGTYVGAYGIVKDLKPAETQERAQHLPKGLTPENGAEVFKGGDNQGFIHGPTMNHAVAAAVLRAGYNSLKSRDDNNNALAINLSSARVRKALHLLEGIAGGQEAGALLGYLYERALHDKYTDGASNPLEMDVYIYRLRRKFPTFGDLPKDSDIDLTENEAIKAANVLDGLAMIDHVEQKLKDSGNYDGNKTFVEMIIDDSGSTPVFNGYPWGFTNQVPDPSNPPTGSTSELERLKLRAMIHELDNMADSFDALGDLMTAEGVYQLVRGNHVRASAVLNALADGKVPLDPEIINSMRRGLMVTHRAMINIPISTSSASPWSGVGMSPRALAEPSINNWLAVQIGDPSKVDWTANFGNTESFMTLEDLGMQPIDLVLMVTSGGEEGLTEVESRCVNYLLENGASETDDIHLNFNISSVNADYSFGEMVSLFHNLGKTILAARSADARDYRVAEDEENFALTSAGIDTASLSSRISNALSDYQILLDSLSVFEQGKENYSNAEADLAFDKLIELSGWGFAGFYPDQTEKDDVVGMASKIVTAKTKMQENISFVSQELAALELELDQAKWISLITDFANRLFGNGFKIMPVYEVSNHVHIRAQLDMPTDTGILRNHAEGYLNEWLSSSALVRKRLAAVESVRLLSDVLHEQQISMGVAQLPFVEPTNPAERDYWLGAEYPDSYTPDSDKLSLVCFGQENVGPSACGLVIDEWMEIIPDRKETTGIALHFNQPDARAPQNVLLAVPPEKTGTWNFDDLILSVEEALNMARLRAVEPEYVDFSMFSQLLPATATLAFGFDEMANRLNPEYDGDKQDLGMYVDYTAVNRGVDPVETTQD